MLVSDIIHSALRKIGAVSAGEVVEPDEQQDALEALQVMLRSWSAEKLNVFSSVHEDFTLVAGTEEYTWGVGGTINTLRPNQVTGVSIVDSSGVTHPVSIIDESKYRLISTKDTSSRPYNLFPRYTYPYVIITLYPVPPDAETLKLESLKPFTESSSFSSVSDTLAIPTHYEEPIIYNLAVRCAPEYGKAIPASVAAIALDSYNRLTTRNAGNQVESIGIDLPVRSSGKYSINSDSYK